MKNIFIAIMLCGSMAHAIEYDITRGTVTVDSISVTSGAAVLASLSPALGLAKGNNFYSVSLYNITQSSAVYALCASATACQPELTCANGIFIPIGSPSTPGSITEKFEGLYMWVRSCAAGTITDMRRIVRGR